MISAPRIALRLHTGTPETRAWCLGDRWSGSSSTDHFEVRVLKRGADHAHLVDVLALGHQLADEPRDVLAGGLREGPRPAPGVDLDAAGVAELGGRARRDDLAAGDDRHPVADE